MASRWSRRCILCVSMLLKFSNLFIAFGCQCNLLFLVPRAALQHLGTPELLECLHACRPLFVLLGSRCAADS
jgi:hypothetical protein